MTSVSWDPSHESVHMTSVSTVQRISVLAWDNTLVVKMHRALPLALYGHADGVQIRRHAPAAGRMHCSCGLAGPGRHRAAE